MKYCTAQRLEGAFEFVEYNMIRATSTRDDIWKYADTWHDSQKRVYPKIKMFHKPESWYSREWQSKNMAKLVRHPHAIPHIVIRRRSLAAK